MVRSMQSNSVASDGHPYPWTENVDENAHSRRVERRNHICRLPIVRHMTARVRPAAANESPIATFMSTILQIWRPLGASAAERTVPVLVAARSRTVIHRFSGCDSSRSKVAAESKRNLVRMAVPVRDELSFLVEFVALF
jgi:hypothetical protein